MVLKGQFLERPTLIPVGPPGDSQVVLEGVSHRGAKTPLLLVLPPTPAEGGGMDHVVGAELAFAAASNGFPVLRFNFRGVGASQGERGGPVQWLEDALAALEVARDNCDGGPVAVVALHGAAPLALELQRLHPGRIPFVGLITPSAVEAVDLTAVEGTDLCVVVGQVGLTDAQRALGEAVSAAGGLFEVVGGADRTFQRGLPQVGRAVVQCLTRAASLGKH